MNKSALQLQEATKLSSRPGKHYYPAIGSTLGSFRFYKRFAHGSRASCDPAKFVRSSSGTCAQTDQQIDPRARPLACRRGNNM